MTRSDFLGIPQTLGPADLSVASAAFEAGLQRVTDSVDGLNAYQIRKILAQHVMEHALHGERDPETLTLAAVQYLELVIAAQADGRLSTHLM